MDCINAIRNKSYYFCSAKGEILVVRYLKKYWFTKNMEDLMIPRRTKKTRICFTCAGLTTAMTQLVTSSCAFSTAMLEDTPREVLAGMSCAGILSGIVVLLYVLQNRRS